MSEQAPVDGAVNGAPLILHNLPAGTVEGLVVGGQYVPLVVQSPPAATYDILHTCEYPGEGYDGQSWPCPECQQVWDKRVDVWWEPREDDES
jgi:hypothetical protein